MHGFSYLLDRDCSIFSGVGKFCLAHGLRQLTRYIGVGRFRILGEGGQGFKYWGGGARGEQIPSRHMTS